MQSLKNIELWNDYTELIYSNLVNYIKSKIKSIKSTANLNILCGPSSYAGDSIIYKEGNCMSSLHHYFTNKDTIISIINDGDRLIIKFNTEKLTKEVVIDYDNFYANWEILRAFDKHEKDKLIRSHIDNPENLDELIWLLNDHMQGYGYDRHKVLKFGKYTVILGEICGVAIENNIVNLLCENDDFWFDGERQFHIGWT